MPGGTFQERRVPGMRRRHRARLCHPTKGWHQRGAHGCLRAPGTRSLGARAAANNGVGRWRGLRAQGWSLCSLRGAAGRARGAGDTRGVRCRRVLGTGCALPLPWRLRGGSHSIPRVLRAGGGTCRAGSTRAGRVPSPSGTQLHHLAPFPHPPVIYGCSSLAGLAAPRRAGNTRAGVRSLPGDTGVSRHLLPRGHPLASIHGACAHPIYARSKPQERVRGRRRGAVRGASVTPGSQFMRGRRGRALSLGNASGLGRFGAWPAARHRGSRGAGL